MSMDWAILAARLSLREYHDRDPQNNCSKINISSIKLLWLVILWGISFDWNMQYMRKLGRHSGGNLIIEQYIETSLFRSSRNSMKRGLWNLYLEKGNWQINFGWSSFAKKSRLKYWWRLKKFQDFKNCSKHKNSVADIQVLVLPSLTWAKQEERIPDLETKRNTIPKWSKCKWNQLDILEGNLGIQWHRSHPPVSPRTAASLLQKCPQGETTKWL